MALPREERMSPHDLLKYVKDQYDRLAEISPLVPPAVIHKFQSRFKKYTDIAKPEEAKGLEKISVYKPSPAEEAAAETPGTVKVKIGPPPTSGTFAINNPMFAAAKNAVVKETFIPSVKSMEEIAESVRLPEIPKETLKEAESKSS
jgi:hypothetical protein